MLCTLSISRLTDQQRGVRDGVPVSSMEEILEIVSIFAPEPVQGAVKRRSECREGSGRKRRSAVGEANQMMETPFCTPRSVRNSTTQQPPPDLSC